MSKVVIIGNHKSGKTLLCNKLQNINDEEKYTPTMGLHVSLLQIENTFLNLWCCSGNINHHIYKYFKKCNLCIIVVNSEEIGFNFWYDYFRVHNKNCPILLCYNLPYDLYIEKKLYDDKNIPNGKQVIKIFNINEIENIKDYLKNINYIGLNFNF